MVCIIHVYWSTNRIPVSCLHCHDILKRLFCLRIDQKVDLELNFQALVDQDTHCPEDTCIVHHQDLRMYVITNGTRYDRCIHACTYKISDIHNNSRCLIAFKHCHIQTHSDARHVMYICPVELYYSVQCCIVYQFPGIPLSPASNEALQ